MSRWFQFWTGNGPSAPIDEAEARAQVARGWLRPDTPCLVPGAAAWQPLAVVAPDLFAPGAPAAPVPVSAPATAADPHADLPDEPVPSEPPPPRRPSIPPPSLPRPIAKTVLERAPVIVPVAGRSPSPPGYPAQPSAYLPPGCGYPRRKSRTPLIAGVVIAVLLVGALVAILAIAASGSSPAPSGGTGTADAGGGAAQGSPLESATGTLDLAAGGSVEVGGATVEVRAGAGDGSLPVTAAKYEAAGEASGDAAVVSAEYEFRLPPGAAMPSGGFRVSIPVTLPPPEPGGDGGIAADDPQFGVETFDEAASSWREIEARVSFDAERGVVAFLVPHFSRYRVVFRRRVLRMQQTQIETPDGHFRISFFQPRTDLVPLSESDRRHLVPTDEEWSAAGAAPDADRDSEVPDVVEDVASAAEEMLKELTRIADSGGTKLFSADGLYPIEIRLAYVSGNDPGDTTLGGPVRINLKSIHGWNDLRVVVAHELVHVLQDQHYTSAGAVWNTWFVDASANLWAARAAGLGAAASQSYWFDGVGDYLRVSLDSGTVGSRYAAADFLAFLEKKTGKAVAADVLTSGENTLGDLGTLVSACGGDEAFRRLYADYVRTTVGTSAALQNVPRFWGRIDLPASSPTATFSESMVGTTVRAFDIETRVAADCLLVIPRTDAVPTVTWKSAGLPIAAPDTYVELESSAPVPMRIPHFGSRGTPGVELFRVQHLVINPGTDSATAGLAYYLLVPPRVADDRTNGRVSWEWTDPGHPISGVSLIKGFNVYVAGVRANPELIDAAERSWSSSAVVWPPPGQDANVVVTVVDHADNEWPEASAPGFELTGEWTGELVVEEAPAGTDAGRAIPAGTRIPVRATFERPGRDGRIPSSFAITIPAGEPGREDVRVRLRPEFTGAGLHFEGQGSSRNDADDRDQWRFTGDGESGSAGASLSGTWSWNVWSSFTHPQTGRRIVEEFGFKGKWRVTRTTP